MTWQDKLAIGSTTITGLSFAYAFVQTKRAGDARRAEARVRKELYRSQVTQRITQLSTSILKVMSLARSDQFELAGQATWDLVADFSHALGFARDELRNEEIGKLQKAAEDCNKIAVLLPIGMEHPPDPADLKLISDICLSSLMYVRQLQGQLDNPIVTQEETMKRDG